MGVIDMLEATGTATRPFLESGYCDILIFALYLYLACYAVRMTQCRVFPWAHCLRAMFFLSQFAFFSLRVCSDIGFLSRDAVRRAGYILWAFNHIDTLAACLLWKSWMTRRTEVMFKRSPMFPHFMSLIPMLELFAFPVLAMFSRRGLEEYFGWLPVQPHVCLLNVLFFFCLMAIKHFQSSPEERKRMKQEFETPENLELRLAFAIFLNIFQARMYWHSLGGATFSQYLEQWNVPAKTALFDIFFCCIWVLMCTEYFKKKEAQEKQEVAASLGIDEKLQDGQLEGA